MGRGIWGISVLSPQFCFKPETSQKKKKKTRSSSAPAGRTPRGGSCVKSDAERGGGYSPGGQLPEFTLSALVFSLWSLTPSALWVSVS